MSNLSQFVGGGIKSIQRGVKTAVNNTATVTITAVDTAKTELRLLGVKGTGSPTHITLTDSTTITFTNSSGGALNADVSWELTERY